ncbi:hypothetical protein Lal_00032529 [Lupinus albus]|nr:hypothetical protein Lal_00032529 [Lupinus albus]
MGINNRDIVSKTRLRGNRHIVETGFPLPLYKISLLISYFFGTTPDYKPFKPRALLTHTEPICDKVALAKPVWKQAMQA